MEIECRRVIQRYRMEGQLDDNDLVVAMERLDKIIRGLSLIAMTVGVKKRAMGAFPVSVKMLDALHLASAISFFDSAPEETLLVFSHDLTMNRCANILGFGTLLADFQSRP